MTIPPRLMRFTRETAGGRGKVRDCEKTDVRLRTGREGLPERGEQRGAIERSPTRVDRRDLPRVGDVVERVGVEDDEIGALAGLERPELGEPQEFGRLAGCDVERT